MMDSRINFHSCLVHKLSPDQTQASVVVDAVDMHIDFIGHHTFIIPYNYQGQINLFVHHAGSAHVTFFCNQACHVTIRVIILFVQQVDIGISVMLCGDDSNVTLLGLCVLTEDQRVDIKTYQLHCGKRGRSNLVLQGLLNQHARLQYDGTIRIEQDASGTYALQNNKNILLSSTAAAVSVPNIEVLHHDVQCYHGAAIGKFDVQHMMYMQSRGLSEQLIKQLLVQELLAPVLQDYEKREFILQKVYEKI